MRKKNGGGLVSAFITLIAAIALFCISVLPFVAVILVCLALIKFLFV